jgi:hypothetical protein
MKPGEQFNLFNEKNEPIVTLSPGQIQIAKKYEEFNVEAGKFKRTGSDWYYGDNLVNDDWEKANLIKKNGFSDSYSKKLHKENGVWYLGDETYEAWLEETKKLDSHENGNWKQY